MTADDAKKLRYGARVENKTKGSGMVVLAASEHMVVLWDDPTYGYEAFSFRIADDWTGNPLNNLNSAPVA